MLCLYVLHACTYLCTYDMIVVDANGNDLIVVGIECYVLVVPV